MTASIRARRHPARLPRPREGGRDVARIPLAHRRPRRPAVGMSANLPRRRHDRVPCTRMKSRRSRRAGPGSAADGAPPAFQGAGLADPPRQAIAGISAGWRGKGDDLAAHRPRPLPRFIGRVLYRAAARPDGPPGRRVSRRSASPGRAGERSSGFVATASSVVMTSNTSAAGAKLAEEARGRTRTPRTSVRRRTRKQTPSPISSAACRHWNRLFIVLGR